MDDATSPGPAVGKFDDISRGLIPAVGFDVGDINCGGLILVGGKTSLGLRLPDTKLGLGTPGDSWEEVGLPETLTNSNSEDSRDPPLFPDSGLNGMGAEADIPVWSLV